MSDDFELSPAVQAEVDAEISSCVFADDEELLKHQLEYALSVVEELTKQARVRESELAASQSALGVTACELELLKMRLDDLSWKPVTPDSLPDISRDETGQQRNRFWEVNSGQWYATFEQWREAGWTHYRPINAPTGAQRSDGIAEVLAGDAGSGEGKEGL